MTYDQKVLQKGTGLRRIVPGYLVLSCAICYLAKMVRLPSCGVCKKQVHEARSALEDARRSLKKVPFKFRMAGLTVAKTMSGSMWTDRNRTPRMPRPNARSSVAVPQPEPA